MIKYCAPKVTQYPITLWDETVHINTKQITYKNAKMYIKQTVLKLLFTQKYHAVKEIT